MAVRRKGKINTWNEDKGYGFIRPEAGGKDVFLHIKSFQQRDRSPRLGELVHYSLSKDRQDRLCAIDATFDGQKLRSTKKQRKGFFAILITAFFLMAVSACIVAKKLPALVLWIYLAASLITLFVYLKDKSAAKKSEWRTQESTLHFLALIGGWPGALIAQAIFRHKSKKTSFRIKFFLTVILNIALLLWLLTSAGSAILIELLNT